MTTKEEFRINLRSRLNDSTSNRWSDAELDSYLWESVNRYSRYFPRLREQQATTNGTDITYPVPDDLVDQKLEKVWLLQNNRRMEIPSYLMRTRRSARYWEIVGEDLIFGYAPPAGATMILRYGALHIIPDEGNSTVPSEDEDLIYLWGEHLAWRKIGGSDASLSRWKEQGNRADGPIIPHYVFLEKQYQRMIADKKAGARVLARVRSETRYRLPGWSTVLGS